MSFRRPFDRYGCHRVLEPAGALPQAAERLDNRGPSYANELAIDVERLNIDSASFHQIVEDVGRDAESVGKRVVEIIDNRGKMENPVTGSGGMLLGTVGAVGPEYANGGSEQWVVGDRVATLVSLTLTPLHVDQVTDVHFEADQVAVDGRAYLPPSASVVKMPGDIDEAVALAIFDVCGAPAQTRRLSLGAESVLILGAGKSGTLCAAAARETFSSPDEPGVEGAASSGAPWVGCLDLHEEGPRYLADHDLIDGWGTADATRPTEVLEAVERLMDAHDRDHLPDLVIDACNVAGTEMAAILSCRERGTVYFFNMATEFSRAALGAEGVGKDVDLLIGNGYADGHAEYALRLAREVPAVREAIEGIVGT